MKEKSSINNKIDAAINSVESIQQAQPSPFFYTRLIAKISNNKVTFWEKISALLLQPAIAFAAVCLIVIINVSVLFYSNNKNVSPANQTETASSDEYNDMAISFYDLENIKP